MLEEKPDGRTCLRSTNKIISFMKQIKHFDMNQISKIRCQICAIEEISSHAWSQRTIAAKLNIDENLGCTVKYLGGEYF